MNMTQTKNTNSQDVDCFFGEAFQPDRSLTPADQRQLINNSYRNGKKILTANIQSGSDTRHAV